ncbi:S-layer homology domain-containing protein [Paenibacillus sp. GCM10023248]|uniref:S-layer homology domain-containing protein n=1 Tax=unclassified Paenibacillus TaxID=185978 RepID=UPI00237974F7|nr:S-layer homology domain-containing protein [Paenibacillus sp. MAHUQ-63]MDD9267261.1 S-layer homology domain-containing protein [Paenibacillus sp. MAHUQ-63]
MISLRRWTIVLLAVWMYAGTLISSASAGAAPAEIHAAYDERSGQVTISGVWGAEQGALVAVHVINPLNQLDVLDQTTTRADGSYQFSYVLKRRIAGIYYVNVSAQHADQTVGTVFEVKTDPTDPDPGHGIPPASTASSGGGTPAATPDMTIDPVTGIVTASLREAQVEQAITAGDGDLVVEFQRAEGAKQYVLHVPARMFGAGSGHKLTIVTEFGSVTVPGRMLSNIPLDSAEEIGFAVALADTSQLPGDIQRQIGSRPVIAFNVTVDGKDVTLDNRNAVVQGAIPYEPTAEERQDLEHITVWYIDPAGHAQAVPSGRYDAETGMVRFTASHFSSYAVVYAKKSFADLDAAPWAKKLIEVMASKGIIAGVSDTSFQPAAHVTRGDFMMLLTKTFGFNAEVTANFSDILPSDYYYEAVGIAKQLGLAEGVQEGLFNPRDEITRQDLMVLLSRALSQAGITAAKGTAEDLEAFSDKSDVAAYAINHVASLMKSGIVEGSGSLLNPAGNATRAEAAALLYRIYSKLLAPGPASGDPDIRLGA